MDYRQLGYSGLKVSELSFGTGTLGGGTEFFRAWGKTDVNEAKRLIDVCLEAGINLFDTADIYSNGLSEIETRRHMGMSGLDNVDAALAGRTPRNLLTAPPVSSR
jgi:aryl-alcohol dehydrogenase-like predicted oxidoreductase